LFIDEAIYASVCLCVGSLLLGEQLCSPEADTYKVDIHPPSTKYTIAITAHSCP